MDGIDGFEVCRRLKANPFTTAIPVLFVTAGDDEDYEVQALELGAADFITKPLRPAIVRARVDTQLVLRKHMVMMEDLVNLDGLTELFNRRYFDDQLETEIARHRRQQQSIALALIDVDHFKRYNDGLGHQSGDDCLRRIAVTLKSHARRPGEVVARYGGEEFVIIIPNTSVEEAERYGTWLCERITDLKLTHPNSVTKYVSISIGIVSCIPKFDVTPRELVELADQALYAAKNTGRNQCVVNQMRTV